MISPNDALSLEYKLGNGCAGRQAHLSDFIYDPLRDSIVSVLGSGLQEQFTDLPGGQPRSVLHDARDFSLIGRESR